jgi:hypothetical protein
MVVSSATLPEYDCSWCRSTVSCLCAILGPMSEAAVSSFTCKRPRDLETQQGRENPAGPGDKVRGRRHRAGESRRVAPAHGTANQFRRSGNRVHRLPADYAGAAGAISVATACIRLPSHGRRALCRAHRLAGEPKGRARILARRARPRAASCQRGPSGLLTSAAATPMSNGGCKVMRTDRSYPRRTTARARPIRYPKNCAPVRPGFDACFLGAVQHREWPAVRGVARQCSTAFIPVRCSAQRIAFSAMSATMVHFRQDQSLRRWPRLGPSGTCGPLPLQPCGGRINAPRVP